MNGIGQDNSKTNLIAGSISVLTICLAVLFFLSLLFAANRGLDYSDESYAYLWARYPFEYRFGLRLSGFFLHPIEQLVQHSITGLRIAGMFLTAASGVLVGIVAAKTMSRTSRPLEQAELIAACGIAMFLGNIYWTNTPSYQHMTVWGLALVLAGLAILIRKPPASPLQLLGGAAFIAIGGLVLAFAKIPSAMGAAALTLGLVFFAHQGGAVARWRMLGLIALVEIVLLAATASLISPSYIFGLFQEGLTLREGSGGLLDVFAKHLVDIWNMPARLIGIFLIAAASMLMTLTATSRRRVFGIEPLTAALVLGAIATCWALVYASPVRFILSSYNPYFHGLRMTALAFAVLGLAGAVYLYRNQNFGRERFLFAMLLIVAPWIASLGTGNNFLQHTAIYSGFSGLAIILVTMELPRLVAQTTRLILVLMSGTALYFAALHPYRLNKPITEQNVPVLLEGLDGTLLVDGPTANFFSTLHDRARAAGLSAGTPLFDLAGFGPGFHLALGTKPPVYPWIAAGYPNSPVFLDKIWSLAPAAVREQAWLIAPVDKTFQGAAALNYLTPLDLNYELVLKAAEPQSGINVELWRPRRAAAAGKS
jgi:hypothetical protein